MADPYRDRFRRHLPLHRRGAARPILPRCTDLEAAKQTVAGTARSMGVEVAD